MSRSYVKVEQLAEEVFRRKEAGETNREIGEHFGLTKDQIKQLVTRQRRKQRMVANGYIICPKGRPRKREETEEIRRNNELVNLRMQVIFCKIFICVEDSETSRISQKLTPRRLEKISGGNFLC
jgi:predicted transcriptional regulator